LITSVAAAAPPRALGRRLLPLQIAMGLQGMLLWLPIEKLFMTQIGFDAASVGVMAAAYAAVVPLLEVPSGILADRWSRSWVMIMATLALTISTLVGGLSTSVITYVVAAMILGVYFALSSGTVDSIVYDTVLEETGSSELYEKWIGRVRAVESAALVISALAGGVLAEYTSARFTYFATIPLVGSAIIGFVWFHEPQLHKAAERVSLASHVAVTFRTMTREPAVLRVLLLVATAALLSQAVFEFGPLWLVALAAPAVVYGPYWAALVSTLGLGGLIVGKLNLDRRWMVAIVVAVPLAAALVLIWTQSLAAVIAAQIVLALLLAIIGIHAGKLLHDAVPSAIRAGVSSGAGTLSWMLFLPFSLAFGWVARENGVNWSGWMLAGAVVVVGVLLIVSIRAARRDVTALAERTARAEQAVAVEDAVGVTGPSEEELACRQLVELVADYLEGLLSEKVMADVEDHLAGCDGCTAYVSQIRQTIAELRRLGKPA
jgi:MFS family permease